MDHAEAIEKLALVNDHLADIEAARTAWEVKKAFGSFSSDAGHVHFYIEENISDWKSQAKGGPSPELTWYRGAIATIYVELFRKLRNTNTHLLNLKYANRAGMSLAAFVNMVPAMKPLVIRQKHTFRTRVEDGTWPLRNTLREFGQAIGGRYAPARSGSR